MMGTGKIFNLPLTEEEGAYLLESLGVWNQGYEEAAKDIETDESIDNLEDFMNATGSASEDIERGQRIEKRIKGKLEGIMND